MNAAVQSITPAAAAEPPLVLDHRAGGVATLTLNRPAQFNPLSMDMMDALEAALVSASADPAVRVVVLAAAGKAFCAGHDLRQIQAHPEADYYRALFARCTRLMLRVRSIAQPVIARVQGIATAGGCQLVAACDLAVASSEARFAVSGIRVGLFCSTPAVPLSRNLGTKAAFEMLVTGDFVDAERARVLGLVNRVASPEGLDDEVARLATAIVEKPPAAIAMGKDLFYRQQEMGVEAAYQLAGQVMACNLMDDSAREGIKAFIEKRPPNWTKAG